MYNLYTWGVLKVVYKLYGLMPEEIEIVEKSNE